MGACAGAGLKRGAAVRSAHQAAETKGQAPAVFEVQRRQSSGFLLLIQTPEWECLTVADDRDRASVGEILPRSLPRSAGRERSRTDASSTGERSLEGGEVSQVHIRINVQVSPIAAELERNTRSAQAIRELFEVFGINGAVAIQIGSVE